MNGEPGPRTASARRTADSDFSGLVLADLYRYRRRGLLLAWVLWALTGLMGGHRFYLQRTGTGLAMLITGGGGGIWWLFDALRLPRMVEAFNDEQARREREGLPPVALAFMPALEAVRLDASPAWAERRGGRVRIAGDIAVLAIAGLALGTMSAQTGNYEGLSAILLLIAVTNLGARWDSLAELPLLRSLDRWSHRLRLYYQINDPGGPLHLLLRPLTGPFLAAFRTKARAEVRLYLELGAVFVILFTLFDLAEAVTTSGSGIGLDAGVLIKDMALTFVLVYAFAAPIGATLTKNLLLEENDRLIWILSAVSVAAIALGLLGG